MVTVYSPSAAKVQPVKVISLEVLPAAAAVFTVTPPTVKLRFQESLQAALARVIFTVAAVFLT